MAECGGEPLEEEPAEQAGKRLHGQSSAGTLESIGTLTLTADGAVTSTVQFGDAVASDSLLFFMPTSSSTGLVPSA